MNILNLGAGGPMTRDEMIELIAIAIACMEGFYRQNSRAARNNNPGNLRSWGSRPVVDGFAMFDTPEAGWRALRQQVRRNIDRGLTLTEFFRGKPGVYSGYAPSADGNRPLDYARYVARETGLPLDRPLFLLAAEPRPKKPQRKSNPKI